jgi:hypothetical protein
MIDEDLQLPDTSVLTMEALYWRIVDRCFTHHNKTRFMTLARSDYSDPVFRVWDTFETNGVTIAIGFPTFFQPVGNTTRWFRYAVLLSMPFFWFSESASPREFR